MGQSDLETAFAGRSVQRVSLVRDQVAGLIREAITAQRFQPGELLVERELCDATGASRASVREALRQLETEGLIVSIPGRGSTVVRLGVEEAERIYDIRAALEALAGRRFVERATDDEIDRLREIAERGTAAVDDAAAQLAVGTEFYELLFRGARNPELQHMVGMLHRRITLLRSLSLSSASRRHRSSEELIEIVAAIARHDGEEVAALLVAHVRAAARAAIDALERTAD